MKQYGSETVTASSFLILPVGHCQSAITYRKCPNGAVNRTVSHGKCQLMNRKVIVATRSWPTLRIGESIIAVIAKQYGWQTAKEFLTNDRDQLASNGVLISASI